MAQIAVDYEKIAEFSRKWQITELALFGSVLRDDFGPDSDVDVLVSFADDARWDLFDLVHMQDELTEAFGRKVDLMTRRGVEASLNQIRKRAILSSAQVLHGA